MIQPTWCSGCGNFGIWAALKNAAAQKKWDNTNTVLVAGIGCHGNLTNFIQITSFEGLHGRALPLAEGMKIANPKLNVFVFSGDGDCLGEGGNHFIHACRRNHDLTLLIHNNGLYSLTTGQASPTSPFGLKTKSTPKGNTDRPFSPLTLALASGASFVARAFSGNLPQLTQLLIQANKHQGLAVIDVLQPCVTFNKEYNYPFFQANCYELGVSHDVKNKEAAWKKSLEWGPKKIPLGIFYQVNLPCDKAQMIKMEDKKRDLTDLFKKYT